MARRLSLREKLPAYMRRLSAKIWATAPPTRRNWGPSRPEMPGPGDVITSNRETSRLHASAKRQKFGPRRLQPAAIGDRPVRRCQALVTSSPATGEMLVGPATATGGAGGPTLCAWPTHLGDRETSRLHASAKRQKFGPRRLQPAAIGDRPVRRCQALVTSSPATGEIVGRARHSYRETSRLHASAKRQKFGPRRLQPAAIGDRPVRRCQALVTSSPATGEIVGRARHSYRWRRRPDFMRLADAPRRQRKLPAYMRRLSAKNWATAPPTRRNWGPSRPEMPGPGDVITSNRETSRLHASAKRQKFGPRRLQPAAIGDRPVRRCQALVTSSPATGEIVGRARHSYRETSRLHASAKRQKFGPRRLQPAAIGDRPVRRCQALVTSSPATGEIVGRARHSYRETSRLHASAKRQKFGPRRLQPAAIGDRPVRRCQALVTSSPATGEIVGRARHSYRWRRRPDFMRLADAPRRQRNFRLHASAKRQKFGPRRLQPAAIGDRPVRRCQALVTSSPATGEIVGRARHSYRETSRLHASAKRQKFGPRRLQPAAIGDRPVRRCQALVTSSPATGEIVGRARHSYRETSRLHASAKRQKFGPRRLQPAAIGDRPVRRCQALVTSSPATGEIVGRARHSYRETSRLHASAKRQKFGPRRLQPAAIGDRPVRRCQALVTSSPATGEIVGRARHSYRETSRLHASAKRQKFGPRRLQPAAIGDRPVRRCQALVTSSPATGEIVGRARHSYRETSRLHASAKRQKFGPRRLQPAAIGDRPVRRCQALVTSSPATGEIVGRARHSYRETSRLHASAKRQKFGPRRLQPAAIGDRPVRRCQALVTSSPATGEIVGRARHSYRETSRLHASAKRQKFGPRRLQPAAIGDRPVRRCQALVTSSPATGEIVGRARHSYRETSRLHASAKRQKFGPRRLQPAAIGDRPVRRCQALVTSSPATGEIVGRARHSYRETSRLHASAKRQKFGPRRLQPAAIGDRPVRRCQALVTSSPATGEIVGRARHSYRETSRLHASAKRQKFGPRRLQPAAIGDRPVRRCQALVTSSPATGEIVGRARHSYRETSRLHASAKRQKFGPRRLQPAAIGDRPVRRCQALVTSSPATGEIVGRARHSYRETSRLHASAKRQKFGPRRLQPAAIGDRPVRRCQALVTSSPATGEIVGRARHSYRETSRLHASAKRQKFGPRRLQPAAIGDRPVRRCQALVTSSPATGEIVGRARHSYRETSRLHASAKRQKFGPRRLQPAAIGDRPVRRCQALVTSSPATGEIVGRARHSYRETSRLHASAKRQKFGPRRLQPAAIGDRPVRRCQALVTSSPATGEIVGRARHSYRETSRLHASAKRQKFGPRRLQPAAIGDRPVRRCQALVTSSPATGEIVGRARHSYRETSRLHASAKRQKFGPRRLQPAAIGDRPVRRCQALVTSSPATGEIVGRARHSYRETSRLHASAKRQKFGPRRLQPAAIGDRPVRRCQALVTSSPATGEIVGRARHSYRETSRLHASAKRQKFGPRRLQPAAIGDRPVRRCQALVTSSPATGEIVGRARHSYRETSRLHASAKRQKFGPRRLQPAAIGDRPVRRCQALVTSSPATGEIVGRARHSYRETSRLHASAKRQKFGPRRLQPAAIGDRPVRRCQALVTSSPATGEIVGRARHSYRETSRLHASAKRQKFGPRRLQPAAIGDRPVRRCQALVTSSPATGEIVGRARHSYRETSRLHASAKRQKFGPRRLQPAAIGDRPVRRCQALVTSSPATGEIVGRARHSYRETSRLHASAKRQKFGPRRLQPAAIGDRPVRRCQALVTSSPATGEIVGRARHSYRETSRLHASAKRQKFGPRRLQPAAIGDRPVRRCQALVTSSPATGEIVGRARHSYRETSRLHASAKRQKFGPRRLQPAAIGDRPVRRCQALVTSSPATGEIVGRARHSYRETSRLHASAKRQKFGPRRLQPAAIGDRPVRRCQALVTSSPATGEIVGRARHSYRETSRLHASAKRQKFGPRRLQPAAIGDRPVRRCQALVTSSPATGEIVGRARHSYRETSRLHASAKRQKFGPRRLQPAAIGDRPVRRCQALVTSSPATGEIVGRARHSYRETSRLHASAKRQKFGPRRLQPAAIGDRPVRRCQALVTSSPATGEIVGRARHSYRETSRLHASAKRQKFGPRRLQPAAIGDRPVRRCQALVTSSPATGEIVGRARHSYRETSRLHASAKRQKFGPRRLQPAAIGDRPVRRCQALVTSSPATGEIVGRARHSYRETSRLHASAKRQKFGPRRLQPAAIGDRPVRRCQALVTSSPATGEIVGRARHSYRETSRLHASAKRQKFGPRRLQPAAIGDRPVRRCQALVTSSPATGEIVGRARHSYRETSRLHASAKRQKFGPRRLQPAAIGDRPVRRCQALVTSSPATGEIVGRARHSYRETSRLHASAKRQKFGPRRLQPAAIGDRPVRRCQALVTSSPATGEIVGRARHSYRETSRLHASAKRQKFGPRRLQPAAIGDRPVRRCQALVTSSPATGEIVGRARHSYRETSRLHASAKRQKFGPRRLQPAAIGDRPVRRCQALVTSSPATGEIVGRARHSYRETSRLHASAKRQKFGPRRLQPAAIGDRPVRRCQALVTSSPATGEIVGRARHSYRETSRLHASAKRQKFGPRRLQPAAIGDRPVRRCQALVTSSPATGEIVGRARHSYRETSRLHASAKRQKFGPRRLQPAAIGDRPVRRCQALVTSSPATGEIVGRARHSYRETSRLHASAKRQKFGPRRLQPAAIGDRPVRRCQALVTSSPATGEIVGRARHSYRETSRLHASAKRQKFGPRRLQPAAIGDRPVRRCQALVTSSPATGEIVGRARHSYRETSRLHASAKRQKFGPRRLQPAAIGDRPVRRCQALVTSSPATGEIVGRARHSYRETSRLHASAKRQKFGPRRLQPAAIGDRPVRRCQALVTSSPATGEIVGRARHSYRETSRLHASAKRQKFGPRRLQPAAIGDRPVRRCQALVTSSPATGEIVGRARHSYRETSRLHASAKRQKFGPRRLQPAAIGDRPVRRCQALVTSSPATGEIVGRARHSYRETSRLHASAKRQKFGPRRLQPAAIGDRPVRRCQALVTSSPATGEIVGRARHSYRETSRLHASAKRQKFGPRRLQPAAIGDRPVRRCQALVTSSPATGEIVGRARHSYRETSRLHASAKRQKFGPRRLQPAAIGDRPVRRCQALVTSSPATGEIVGRARHSYRETSRLHASAKRQKFGPRRLQLAAIGDRPVRRCQALVTSSPATGEIVGRARHSYRETSRLHASAKRQKFGPRRLQLAAIGDRPVRRCQALVTSSPATGEIVGRARHSYRETSRLHASAKRQKFGPRRLQLAAIGDRPVRRCQALVTSSPATGEIVGRARHSYRWRRRPDFMRLADAPRRQKLPAYMRRLSAKKFGPRRLQPAAIGDRPVRRCQALVTSSPATGEIVGRARHSYRETSRLHASAKRQKFGPRRLQLAAIGDRPVRRCQALVTSSPATGEIVGRARHSYRETSRLHASAKRQKFGPRRLQPAAIGDRPVRRCQALVTSSPATGEIVGRARHSYRETSRLHASAKCQKFGPRRLQPAAIGDRPVRRCQALVTSSPATGEIVGRARHSYRETSRLHASAKRQKFGPRRLQLAAIGDRPVRRCQALVTSSPATATGGAGGPTLCAWPTHLGDRETSRLHASAKRQKFGPRCLQLAAIGDRPVRRCQALVTSSPATGEIVGRARHSYRETSRLHASAKRQKFGPRRLQPAAIGDRPVRRCQALVTSSPATARGGAGGPTLCAWPTHLGDRETSRLHASAKRQKFGPRRLQLAAIGDRPVRRCQALVTSSPATGEIVGRARHSYRETSRLHASAKRQKFGPRRLQLAAIGDRPVRRCQALVTSSPATGEIVGRARHSYRETSRLHASAKRQKFGPRRLQPAAIGDRPVRRCQALVTSSPATGEIVGRARHSYRETSRLHASAKRQKFGPRRLQPAAIGDRPVRRCQALVTSSPATGEIVGRARHSYRETSRLHASAKRQKFGPRRLQPAAIGDRPVRRCQALVTSSPATGEIVGRARHSCRWRRRPDFMRLADAPGLG
ncbi:hypothetical protein Bbelb_372270 [Branchiostoma belcheri]|nr:hypothetical protein Bbelb_372270 [Branchiostoma belcheri]